MTELAMAPKKAEIVSHWRGAAIGALKKAFLVTRPKQIGAKIPTTVHVAVGKVILWNLNKCETHFSYWYSIWSFSFNFSGSCSAMKYAISCFLAFYETAIVTRSYLTSCCRDWGSSLIWSCGFGTKRYLGNTPWLINYIYFSIFYFF